jgi:hypothetical protein
VCRIIETSEQQIATTEFKETYGILVESILPTHPYLKRIYYPLYLFRRFTFMCIIALIPDYLIVQVSLVIGISIPVLVNVMSRSFVFGGSKTF